MILARPTNRWVGKVVAKVEPLDGRDDDTLFMTRGVRLTFASPNYIFIEEDGSIRDEAA